MFKKYKIPIALVLLSCFIAVFFCGIFKYDNKYKSPPPYGQDGVFLVTEEDFLKKMPIFLIDGWLLSDSRVEKQETYIGEFSNLQRGDLDENPHGKASYELILRYSGNQRIVAIDFPELFSRYKIYVNEELISEGVGNAHLLFSLQNGDNRLIVETISRNGYYSGMYYPAALGDETAVLSVERIQIIFYSIAMFCTAILLSFTIQLWRRNEGDRLAFWIALLCIFFACYVSYFFVHLFSLPFAPAWYFVEEMSLYSLVFCLIQITHTLTGLRYNKIAHISSIMAILIPVIMLILHTMIPYWTMAVCLHGQIKNLYFVLTFLWLLGATLLCISRKRSEYPFIVAGNFIFGTGLFLNLFQSNLFEPIFTLWQFEWCGLLIVWLFASLMVARNHRILWENKQFTIHLEGLVEQRTEELSCVIEERRAFFSDMAHDLKSPLFATKTFIDAIRTHSVYVDEELEYYLNQLDNKQTEMSKRVQSLNTLNTLDKIEAKKERLSIQAVLEEVYAIHNADAEVGAIRLIIRQPESDCFVYMQQEKLLLAFENLIFNALLATAPGGSITIAARDGEKMLEITVDDTGCGISEAELPFIFKRFYSGERNKSSGSGLGLYITKTIIEEVGGKISATSQVGRGTRFLIEIPHCL